MPFHYTAAIEEVLLDLVIHVPELSHIDPSKIIVSFAEARQRTCHGIYAKVMPAREGLGAAEFAYQGRRALYLMYFYLPRFHDQPLLGKVSTIIHECYHISPKFDGAIRRLSGGRPHGHSMVAYERAMDAMARSYLAKRKDWTRLDFLGMSTEALVASKGPLYGLRIQESTRRDLGGTDSDGPRRLRDDLLDRRRRS